MKYKELIQDRLREWNVRFVDLDDVIEDGMVRDQSHVEPAVAHLQAEGIDALFLPHCNFGTEGAVGMIARQLAVPTLLWGPRDEAPLADGTRLRDSLCGMFASSKVLRKLGVPFSYIENCRVDDPPFKQGMDRFLRAANVANALRKGIRIGHIGQRIDFFWTTIVNEGELLTRFNVEVLPIDMVDFVRDVRSRVEGGTEDYRREAERCRKDWKVEHFDTDEPLMNILAVRDQIEGLVKQHQLDGIALQDFTSLVEEMGAYCFMANSMVGDHLPLGCESDIHGAISAVLLERAVYGSTVFLADITARHPENDNGILMWHAGAPLSMCHPEDEVRVGKHWILPSPLSGMGHFKMMDGPITVARFDGETNAYTLAIGEGKSIDGPETQNNYTWMEVNDWPAWERALMEGPFIHHAAMTYDHVADALEEACRFVPGLTPLRLG